MKLFEYFIQRKENIRRIREQYSEKNTMFDTKSESDEPKRPFASDFDHAMRGGTALFLIMVFLRAAVVLWGG